MTYSRNWNMRLFDQPTILRIRELMSMKRKPDNVGKRGHYVKGLSRVFGCTPSSLNRTNNGDAFAELPFPQSEFEIVDPYDIPIVSFNSLDKPLAAHYNYSKYLDTSQPEPYFY